MPDHRLHGGGATQAKYLVVNVAKPNTQQKHFKKLIKLELVDHDKE